MFITLMRLEFVIVIDPVIIVHACDVYKKVITMHQSQPDCSVTFRNIKHPRARLLIYFIGLMAETVSFRDLQDL